jgi:hypothetical protein
MLAAGDVAGRHGPWLRQVLTSPEDAQLIDAVRSYVSRL